jgi:ADP-ribosylglycohydrolase
MKFAGFSALALKHLAGSFDEMIRFAAEHSGDVDTIAAMAAAMWRTANRFHRVPPAQLDAKDRLLDAATKLYARQSS